MKRLHVIAYVATLTAIAGTSAGCGQISLSRRSVAARLKGRDFPSVFQAWNPIDMPERYPLAESSDRLRAAAKHDLLWEEPVRQTGGTTQPVLGATWDHEHPGLATQFTPASRTQALANRREMLATNPNMIVLMEIRWKDAPGGYLPEDSPWWMRTSKGKRRGGWAGGPEPYYRLDYENAEFRRHVTAQAMAAVQSGVYDGVMLDSWGSHGESNPDCVAMLKSIREAIGPRKLIIVNNSRIAPLPNSAPYVNGAFMEITYEHHNTAEGWRQLREHLLWFEDKLQAPVTNCLEIQAGTQAQMQAGLALALVYSNGFYLFAKNDNSHPAPDHLHDWFDAYEAPLGKPLGGAYERPNGTAQRPYEHGIVVYNPRGNGIAEIQLARMCRRTSNGQLGRQFSLADGDGDIFVFAD